MASKVGELGLSRECRALEKKMEATILEYVIYRGYCRALTLLRVRGEYGGIDMKQKKMEKTTL